MNEELPRDDIEALKHIKEFLVKRQALRSSLRNSEKYKQANNMGTLFDNRQFLHGLPVPGQKITYVKPTKFAFHSDIIENEKELLELGKQYTVKSVSLNSSSTYVVLEEFYVEGLDEYRNNQKDFNLGAFSYEKPPLDPEKLIGFSKLDLYHIMRNYKINIEFNGETLTEVQGAQQTLQITTEVRNVGARYTDDIIVTAQWKLNTPS